MKKRIKSAFDVSFFGDIREISVLAIFSALSIVLGKYLAINIGQTYRISFENLPIILAGVFFGACAGGFVGLAADLIGCLLVGYAINPIITFGAVLIGALSGMVWNLFYALPNFLRALLTVFIPHIIGSVLVKTIGMTLYYGSHFIPTLTLRAVTYFAVAIAELLAVFFLTKNKGFMNQIKRVGK